MKTAVVIILVFLAVSSGITKIGLMEQDVAFFGAYGFSNAMLIAFGIVQVIGGGMLIAPKTRRIGAALVGITFLISAIILFLHGSIAMGLITCVATAALAWVGRNPA